jgi:hypothetical protein
MPTTQSLPAFHRWLLGGAAACQGACAIVIHRGPADATPQLAPRIAAHLNEYDGEGEGRWISIPAEMVGTIANDPAQRALLGIGEGCANCPPASPCGLKKTLAALAKHGHVVLESPLAAAATHGVEQVFHVGVGLPPDGLEDCHVIINPELFQADCIPQVIADVYLEWFACASRQPQRTGGL